VRLHEAGPADALSSDGVEVLSVPSARAASFARFVIPALGQFVKEVERAVQVCEGAHEMYSADLRRVQVMFQSLGQARSCCAFVNEYMTTKEGERMYLSALAKLGREPLPVAMPGKRAETIPSSLNNLLMFVAMHIPDAKGCPWNWTYTANRHLPVLLDRDRKRVICTNPTCPGFAAAEEMRRVQTEMFTHLPEYHTVIANLARTMKKSSACTTEGLRTLKVDGSGRRRFSPFSDRSDLCRDGEPPGTDVAPAPAPAPAPGPGKKQVHPEFSKLPVLSETPTARRDQVLDQLLGMVPSVPVTCSYSAATRRFASHETHQGNALATFLAAEKEQTCLLQRLAMVPALSCQNLIAMVVELEKLCAKDREVVTMQRLFSYTFAVDDSMRGIEGPGRHVQPCGSLYAHFLGALASLKKSLADYLGLCRQMLAMVREAAFGSIWGSMLPFAEASDKQFRIKAAMTSMTRLANSRMYGSGDIVTACPTCVTCVEDISTRETTVTSAKDRHGAYVQDGATGRFRCVIEGCPDPDAIHQTLAGTKCDVCDSASFRVAEPYRAWFCSCDPKQIPVATDRIAAAALQKEFLNYKRRAQVARDPKSTPREVAMALADLEALPLFAKFYDWAKDAFVAPHSSIVNPETLQWQAERLHDAHIVRNCKSSYFGARQDLTVITCKVIECMKCKTPVSLPTVTAYVCQCLHDPTIDPKKKVDIAVSYDTGVTQCTRCGLVTGTEVLSEAEEHRSFVEDGVDKRHAGAPSDHRLCYLPSTGLVQSADCTRDQLKAIARLQSSLNPMLAYGTKKADGTSMKIRDEMKMEFFGVVQEVVDKGYITPAIGEELKDTFAALREAEKLQKVDQFTRLLIMGIFKSYKYACALPKPKDVVCENCNQVIPKGPLHWVHYKYCPKSKMVADLRGFAATKTVTKTGTGEDDRSLVQLREWCMAKDASGCILCGQVIKARIPRMLHMKSCAVAARFSKPHAANPGSVKRQRIRDGDIDKYYDRVGGIAAAKLAAAGTDNMTDVLACSECAPSVDMGLKRVGDCADLAWTDHFADRDRDEDVCGAEA
jgi:hypothetical protein